jgi:hypothetical protein
MEAAVQSKPAPLLRKDQVEDMESDREAAVQKIRSPHFQGDKGAVSEQLRALEHQLESQRPRPYGSAEIDGAIKREVELREQIRVGMLSQEEMRKCPPGAVDRHRAWEKRNMGRIEEWQNIQRRLTCESDERESASIETFRPTANTMNLDNALIPGRQFYLPPVGAAAPVTFSDQQIAVLRALNPAIADMLATLDNTQRAAVKKALDVPPVTAKKRVMSDAQKDALRRGREAAAEKKKAA